jgi:hypothetical protein
MGHVHFSETVRLSLLLNWTTLEMEPREMNRAGRVSKRNQTRPDRETEFSHKDRTDLKEKSPALLSLVHLV